MEKLLKIQKYDAERVAKNFEDEVNLESRNRFVMKEYVNWRRNEYVNLQMTSSGIPGVTMDAVSYVQKALLPGQTNPEAAATFARMIESSLKSWFTQFNFFLHNLAQLRFSGEQNDGELLSFIPRTYT